MTDVAPYRQKLEDGVEVNKAWEQSKDEIDENSRYGTWKADYFLSKPDPAGRFCHATEIRSADSEAFWYQMSKTSHCMSSIPGLHGRQSHWLVFYLACCRHDIEDDWYQIFNPSSFGIHVAASTVTPVLHFKPRGNEMCST